MLRAKTKPLLIRDEIHGDMSFDKLLRLVIDHEGFQRLRRIKQLGLAEYVFPCATHTRFQHSLGAAWLAGQYYQNMVDTWLTSPFRYDGQVGKTRFFAENTLSRIQSVAAHTPSHQYWWQVVALGGLLHDVGHGPWSHSFEGLNLKQDFSREIEGLTGALRDYFDEAAKSGRQLMHEDLSVLYVARILRDLAEGQAIEDAEPFILPVAALVNRRLVSKPLEAEMDHALSRVGIQGGVDFHRLLRPMISGPFDADRIDYIQRDGRNCGVPIGGIEWRRIVTKLVPCLADHRGDGSEPGDVVLVSDIKNQHVLDDFIFSLFQMYAQVYMHPKIVGLEENIRQVLEDFSGDDFKVSFDIHKGLSDEKFRMLLEEKFGMTEVEDLLQRRAGGRFNVRSFPEDSGMEEDLKGAGFSLVDTEDRPMMKDSMGVFLYTSTKKITGMAKESYCIKNWLDVSPIAKQFHSIHHSPKIWIRKESPAKD